MDPAERARSFHGATVWRRMLTVLAGPVFNFLLTIVVFAGIALWQGVPTERPTVGAIATVPGVEQPLREGDVLVEVNGVPAASFEDLYSTALAMETPAPIPVTVERGGDDARARGGLSAAGAGAGRRAALAGERGRPALPAT